MIDEKRLHPLQIIPYIGKYLFLLLLPAARGLLAIRSPEALYAWVRGAWFDILVLLVIVLFSYFTWRCNTFACDGENLIIKSGLFIKRESRIPLAHITTLSSEAPFYLVPVGARRVFVDTAGGALRSFDFQLLMRSRDAEALLSLRLQKPTVQERGVYRPKWRYLVFLSVVVSSTLTGVLFVATAFNQAGKILGREFQQLLLSELETLAGVVEFIPRTAALIALIVLIGWGITFLRNLLHYVGFSVTRYNTFLYIRTGLFIRRQYTCPVKGINYLDYRQSVLSNILRLNVVFIQCIGYGKRKNDKAVLVPAASRTTTDRTVKKLLWEFSRKPVQVRPAFGALWRYTRWQLLACALLVPAVMIFSHFFPFWAELIRLGGAVCVFPLVWRLVLALFERAATGIAAGDDCLTLCYAKGFVLHTVVLPHDRVSCIQLRQSVFQKPVGACDVWIYSYNERATAHRIRQLPLADVKKILHLE